MNHVWRVPSPNLKLLATSLFVCFVIVMSLGVVRETHPGPLITALHSGVKILGLAIALAIAAGAVLGWWRRRDGAGAMAVVMAILGVAALVAFQVIASQEGPDSADIGSGALVPLGLLLSVGAALTVRQKS